MPNYRRAIFHIAAVFIGIGSVPYPATATVVSEAGLSGITWSLASLAPAQGILPVIDFQQAGVNHAAANSFTTVFETHSQGGFGGVGDASASAPLEPRQTATANVATGQHNGQLTQLTASAAGMTYADTQGHFGKFDATATSHDWVFTLSPYSQVTFGATSTLRASMTGGAQETAFTSAWLAVSDLPIADPVRHDNVDVAYVDLRTENLPESRRSLTSLSVVFDNPGNASIAGYLSMTTYVQGYSLATPVPEPTVWALMLSGLAVVGCQYGRRRGRGD